MANLIIPATKSLTVTNKYPDKNLNEGTITIGFDNKNNYYSYLFFDISPLPSDIIISSAELVLFKTDKFFNNTEQKISISPLRDYFSTYTTYNNIPNYDQYLIINFYPLTSKVSVTINVTTIVSSWIKNRPSNKGVFLYGKSKCPIVNFGASKNDDTSLIPFLKVYYEQLSPNRYGKTFCKNNTSEICNKQCIKICKEDLEEIISKICNYIYCNKPCPPPIPPQPHPPNDGNFTDVNVTGNVAPYSVYNVIVEVEVTRAGTSKKDYYYTSDTYINSSNPNSLAINKNYQIAIVAKLQPGDTQTVNLYGSYKGPVINP